MLLKTPIYIKGSRGKYRIPTNSELRLSNFLTISCLLIARRFDLQPGSLCDQLLAMLGPREKSIIISNKTGNYGTKSNRGIF